MAIEKSEIIGNGEVEVVVISPFQYSNIEEKWINYNIKVNKNLNNLTYICRNLRKRMTESERKLWRYLRAKQLLGIKFRRQQQIGKYIVDFYCSEKKIIIEVDVGQHANNKKDKIRDNYLKIQGIEVIRIWNDDIINNIKEVIEYIIEKIKNRTDSYRYIKKKNYFMNKEKVMC